MVWDTENPSILGLVRSKNRSFWLSMFCATVFRVQNIKSIQICVSLQILAGILCFVLWILQSSGPGHQKPLDLQPGEWGRIHRCGQCFGVFIGNHLTLRLPHGPRWFSWSLSSPGRCNIGLLCQGNAQNGEFPISTKIVSVHG